MSATALPLPPFPLASKSVTGMIEGHDTQVIATPFEDHFFLVITQIGKVGTMIQATKDVKENVDAPPTYEVRTLLGKRDEPVLEVYARRLVELLHESGKSGSLLLGIALRSTSKETFREVLQLVEQVM